MTEGWRDQLRRFTALRYVHERLTLAYSGKGRAEGRPEVIDEIWAVIHNLADAADEMLAVCPSVHPKGEEGLTVLQVACLSVGGAIVTLPRPARHGDVMHLMAFRPGPEAQGFLLSDGSFADREEVYRIARAAGQPWLRDPAITSEYLFTEDLW